jgi:1-acyl-sn-glycerol-3-phosphate acyltransferase
MGSRAFLFFSEASRWTFRPDIFISENEAHFSSGLPAPLTWFQKLILLKIVATISAFVGAVIASIIVCPPCIVAALLKVPDTPRAPYDAAPRVWSKILLAFTGVRIVVHGRERIADASPHVIVANHVSWFDIPAVASQLQRGRFVSKAEVFRVPLFGHAMRAVGMIPIERQNRKAAFGAYNEATKRIRDGKSVVVFPEGSRGTEYALRPFKKGPFVFAIDAGVPVIPVLIHGTRGVFAKGAHLMRPGKVDVHFLEPVQVDGMNYDARDRLATEVRSRIADALRSIYGIESPPQNSAQSSAD